MIFKVRGRNKCFTVQDILQIANIICIITLIIFMSSTSAQSECMVSGDTDCLHQRNPRESKSCLINSTSDTLLENISVQESSYQWRWNYIEEQGPEFHVLVHEKSLDERLSNVIYTVNSAKIVNVDSHRFNLASRELSRKYKHQTAGPKVDNELCGYHLKQMLNSMDELSGILDFERLNRVGSYKLTEKHIRLARVLDSFGRYEAGALSGRNYFMGSYSQCSGTPMILDTSDSKTSARYCLAKLKVDGHLDIRLKSREKMPREAGTYLSVGICVPESCHTLSFNKHKELLERLIDSQFKLPKSIYIDEKLELDSIFCMADEGSHFLKIPLSGNILIVLLVSWLVLVVYATYHHEIAKSPVQNYWSRLSSCLSLRQTWQDFVGENLEDKYDTARVDLNTLNPIKVLGCAFVVLGHSLMVHSVEIVDVLRMYKSGPTDPFLMLIAGGTVVVDTFYVISGILLTYIAIGKDVGNPKKLTLTAFSKQWFKISAVRFLRLAPLYFIVFWFKRSVLVYLGSGPFWDHGFNRETQIGACREESWLTPFTFMAAYLPLSKQCLPQSWSVAGDLLLSVVLAPIIVVLTNRPKIAVALSAIICLTSYATMLDGILAISPELKSDLNKFKFHAIARSFSEQSFLYTGPHYRVFSVLVGVPAGYMLHSYNHSKKLKEWPKWFTGPATKISLAFIMIQLLSPLVIALWPTIANQGCYLLFEQSITSGRLLWGISNAVIFVRMATDWKDTFTMRNSAGKFWSSMAKLNFSILLVHVDVLLVDIQSQLAMTYYSRHRILTLFASTYFFSCTIGLLLYSFIESPINKLLKLITVQGFRHNQIDSEEHKKLKL